MKTYYILIITLCLISCSDGNSKKNKVQKEYKEIQAEESIDTFTLIKNVIQPSHVDSKFEKIKSIVNYNYSGNKLLESKLIKSKEAIKSIQYVVNLFDVNKIDSIEIYGVIPKKVVLDRYLPMNSLMTIYSTDKKFKEKMIDSLNSRTRNCKNNIEKIFKPGGIAFSIENDIFLFSINSCGPGFKQIKKIDSLIKQDIFEGQSFYRLQSGCGMGPMIIKRD